MHVRAFVKNFVEEIKTHIWSWYYRHKFARVGKNLRVRGKITVKGKGKIFVGDDVVIEPRVYLYAGQNATITIGDRSYLNSGSGLSAELSITVGKELRMANAGIMDSDYHGLDGNPAKRQPVMIGDHVWIAADRIAGHEFTVGHEKWFQTQVRVGAANAELWQVQSGFDWAHVKKVRVVCWFDSVGTGGFWVDGLFFGGRRYSSVQEDAGSQASYGLRELVEVDEELWSDLECASRAEALLASLKAPAEQLALRSTVVDYGTTPLLPGDTVHVTLPNEGVNGDFRILSVEYNVDAKTQTLETLLELGREAPLLADYVYALRSKTDHLSRYKTAKQG